MADMTMKKYVDYAGLVKYDELIKKFIKEGNTDVVDKLIALIGAAEKGADEKTILARVADLETAVGMISATEAEVASLKALGNDLVKALLGENTRAVAAEEALGERIDGLDLEGANATSTTVAGIAVQVEQEDGKIKKPVVTVADNAVTYTAKTETTAANLAIAEGKDGDVLKGQAIAAIKSYVDAKSDDANADLEALEEKLYGKGEGEDHVDGDIDKIQDRLDVIEGEGEGSIKKAIADLDVAESEATSAKVAGVQVKVSEVDGKVQAPTVTVDDNKVEYVAKTETEAAKVTVADTAAVLKGDAVAEIIKYVDAMDAANASDANDRLDALEATHATKEDGSFKTVAEEVNEAVTDLIDGAPDALDTLKEIADWIANQDESGVTDAASLIARVDTLTGADTVDGSVANSIKVMKESLDAEESGDDAGIEVTVTEEDGVITDVAVDVTAAELSRTAYQKAAGEAAEVSPALAVKTADDSKVLDGSAIADIVGYVMIRLLRLRTRITPLLMHLTFLVTMPLLLLLMV